MIKFTFALTTYACMILLQGFTGMTGVSDTGINTLTVATIQLGKLVGAMSPEFVVNKVYFPNQFCFSKVMPVAKFIFYN